MNKCLRMKLLYDPLLLLALLPDAEKWPSVNNRDVLSGYKIVLRIIKIPKHKFLTALKRWPDPTSVALEDFHLFPEFTLNGTKCCNISQD